MNRFYKNLLKHNWPYFSGILVLLIAVFVLQMDLDKKLVEIKSQHAALASRTNSLESLATLRGQADKAAPYFSFLENILPPRDQLLSFSKEIEDIARKNNLEFGFTFGEEKLSSGTQPGQIAFRISATGSYVDVSNFIKSIETSRYFIDIINVDLTKKGSVYSALINGKVFFR